MPVPKFSTVTLTTPAGCGGVRTVIWLETQLTLTIWAGIVSKVTRGLGHADRTQHPNALETVMVTAVPPPDGPLDGTTLLGVSPQSDG